MTLVELFKYLCISVPVCNITVLSCFTGCFKKVAPYNFWNIFTSVKSFCAKCCKFVGNSYPHYILLIFVEFILIFHQMALIFPRVATVFTLSSFKYSPRQWKCSVPAFRKWRHFYVIACLSVR